MNTILTTAFEGNQNIRVLGTFENPIFVVKDICEVLGLTNPSEAIKSLEKDDLTSVVLRSGGQDRELNAVNESGLYQLIFQSRKPEAKKFCRWVTSEVLPSLRRQGFYLMTGGEPAAMAEVHALTYRLEAAKLRVEAEVMERRALCSVEIPEGVAIKSYLDKHRPELGHKQRANLTRAIKRAIVKQLHRPVGVARQHGNKYVAAQVADIEAALNLVEQPA
jgi:prophage antirepressor-like protein